MRRVVPLLLVALLALSACFDDRQADDHELVQQLAREAFADILEGDVDAWLHRVADFDSLPEEYRLQLRDAMLQHLDNEQRAHGGLLAATVVGDSIVSDAQAEAYVQLLYADSLSERIHLPMIKQQGEWMIK